MSEYIDLVYYRIFFWKKKEKQKKQQQEEARFWAAIWILGRILEVMVECGKRKDGKSKYSWTWAKRILDLSL